jgi:hypothetical protein
VKSTVKSTGQGREFITGDQDTYLWTLHFGHGSSLYPEYIRPVNLNTLFTLCTVLH